tara:strand:+ start:1763 stop:2965 length:1203 start_codon:yes stop_codon:yes gene_type:complete
LKLSIDKFFILFLSILSLFGSTYFIRDFLEIGEYVYFLQIFISILICGYLIQKKPLYFFWNKIQVLKYFLVFFTVNILIQLFYHDLSFFNQLKVFAYFLSFFSSVLVMSYLFDKEENFNFFINISRKILYLIIIFGIFNSLNLIQSNLFFVPHKEIGSYNFLFFNNTASLLEHQISYGTTIAILFSTILLIDKMVKKLFIIMCSILAIFVSFSRTAWLAMVGASFLSNLKLKNITLFVLAFFLIIIIIPNEFFFNILRIEKLGSGREVVWVYAIEMLKDNFWFGFGFSSYYDIKNIFLTDLEFELFVFESTDHLHNSYLTLIFESGIVVALIYIFAIIKHFTNIPLSKNKNIIYYILFVFLISSFFVEFRLGGLRFFNFFFMSIIAYLLSIKTNLSPKIE